MATDAAFEQDIVKLKDSPALERMLRVAALASDEHVRRYRALWVRQARSKAAPSPSRRASRRSSAARPSKRWPRRRSTRWRAGSTPSTHAARTGW